MNCVVKNENQALHYEDARSATLAGQYIKYKEGNWNYIKDGEYSDASYMEWNSYYRMLNGLPPAYTLNDENAYFSATGYDDSIYEDIGNAYVIPELYEKYFIDVGQYDEKYEGKYLHELNTEDLSVISVEGGILDQIKADYTEDPHYQYIYHLGDKRVDFYTARKAVNFAMLYCPSLNTFDIIENKFKRMYDRNRRYTMSTVYSEAYRFMSYHYDAFIQILIIIQTMVDMISEVQEYIINKDVFDSRTIRYLFESYGIAYYKEIPTKYQIRIIKNVNTLLKYKSSHRNITDILELFDDDTITVFTYYLMKIKAINRDNFYYYEESDINPRYVNTDVVMYVGRPEDISNNKVPLMNVHTNQDDITVTKNDDGKVIKENFIRTYLYNYYLIDEGEPDTASNRAISMSDSQPIVSKYAETIDIATDTINNGSFVLDFLNTVALNNKGLPWFGTDNYNIDESKPSSKEYLANRNVFLNRYKNALTNLIRIVFNEETAADDSFALNQYNFRRIKYRLYSILGIFDYDGIAEKFNNRTLDDITDAELESLFYTADTLITEKYCNTHGIESLFTDFLESDDRYILNHTIPFMVWNEYKYKDASDDPETTEYYTSDYRNYIFNSNGSFSANYNKLGDLYTKYTKAFRESYIISTRVFIEAVFDDMAYDSINNPTPRYTGWMDISQVVSKTGKSLDELELGDEITIHTGDNVPIYKSAYVYEVITKDMLGLEYYRKNYDLCFLKVPILDPNAYAVIERRDLRRSYDSITLADPFWDGVSTFDLLTDEERDKLHQSKKQEILNKDFTIERTKYIAVEANIDLVKMSYQVSYFMNMLYDKHMDEEDLMVEVDSEISDDKVRLNDLLTFAIALNFIYNGTEPDNIASDMEKNMYINGFNFDTDWSTIYNYLENKCYINNNYDNEIHEYTYIDEFGVSHTNVGYGMDPMGKGWLTEIYDDTVTYGTAYCSDEEDYVEVKAYFGYPIYGYNENNEPIFSYSDEENQPTGSPINNRIPMPPDSVDHSKVPDPAVGAFLSGRYEQCSEDCATTIDMELDFGSSEIWNYNLKHHPLVSTTGELTVLNIAWEPTQYPDSDNNSHGLWLDTEILTTLTDESITDLDKINYLKKIYYSNTNLYDHLTYMLRHAESKRMYDIYKVLFDSFMETKMNHDYYGQIDRNGNPVYTNENDTSELYYLTLSDEVECDPNGFPIFEGTDLETNKVAYYQFDYKKAVETNFKVCEYYNIANPSEVYDCFYNMRTINGEEVKEYIVHYDEQNQLGRETYFFPSSENHFFTFNVNEQNYLVYNDNPSIKIPVDLDSDGNVIIDENKKYVIIEDEDGNYTVEIVDKSEKVTNGKEVIITKKIAESYYDFLEYRNPSLYALLIDLKYNYDNVPVKVDDNDSVVRYMPSDEKKKRIETLCELIVEALEKYFDKSEWRYLFNLIPTANIENIQNYIMKMVVFFKSWKTQILDTTVSYIIDDPYNNHVHILDDMYYNTTFDNLLEKVRPKEYKYFENHTVYKDPIKVGEDLQMNDVHYEPYTIDFGFAEKIYGHRFDYPNLTSKLIFKDKIGPSEKLEMNTVYYTGEVQQDSNGNILLP
jgi:hypothetical protein